MNHEKINHDIIIKHTFCDESHNIDEAQFIT